jgi:hypothetical protein
MYALRTEFFDIISKNFNSIAPAWQKSFYPLLVSVLILHLQPFYFFTNPIISPKIYQSLKDPKRWKSDVARSGPCCGWRRTFHASFVVAFCILKLVCARALSCCRKITATFCVRPPLTRFCKVLRVLMNWSELTVRPHVIISIKIAPSVSQKQWKWRFQQKG